MKFYYAGFTTSSLFGSEEDIAMAIDSFGEVIFPGLSDIEIGWDYFLLWKADRLYLAGRANNSGNGTDVQLLEIPGTLSESCKKAAPGRDSIIILSSNNNIWQYKIFENSWKRVPNFVLNDDNLENEYPVKTLQGGCVVILTNLGRVFNVPTLIGAPKRTKFVDIACGFDHTILLAQNGDIYSQGMGTRGQLGHNDLEDCDNARIIEALAGIKVVQIAAGGWHSAVITDQGDLYTWGWNTSGELGFLATDTKVIATPTLVDFKDEMGETVEVLVKKVQCGNNFTICMTDDGQLWGCGCNKYGQLGQSRETLTESPTFLKLEVPLNSTAISDFKCREWGTVIATN